MAGPLEDLKDPRLFPPDQGVGVYQTASLRASGGAEGESAASQTARILGTAKSTGRQTSQQAADQAAFDRRMGFTQPARAAVKSPDGLDYAENYSGTFGSGWKPSDNRALDSLRAPPVTPSPVRPVSPVAPASGSLAAGYGNNKAASPVPGAPPSANPNPGAEKVLSGIPPALTSDVTVASAQPPALGATDLTNLPPPAPTAAEVAGASVRKAIGSAVSAVTPPASVVAPIRTAAANRVQDVGTTSPLADIPGTVSRGLSAVGGFARGLAGRSTAAGVSNAQAARIEQPTKANPIPRTDTTPTANIDETPNAISRFGKLPANFFEDANTRRKFGFRKAAFAGF